MTSARRRRASRAAVAVLTVVALAGGPASAQASAEPCGPAPAARTFLPWLDPAHYVLAPAGDLENAGSWQLSGGAAVVDGNEPFYVGGATDSSSLRVPAGGSATTAPMCVGLEHPTLRFFAKRESASAFGMLRVEVLSEGHALPIGYVLGPRSWAPTLPMAIVANALVPEVAFRFTSVNGSEWSIDDVYVDPYRTN